MKWTYVILLSALLVPSQSNGGIFFGRGGLFFDEKQFAEEERERIEKIRVEEGVLFEGLVFKFTRSSIYPFPGLELGMVATSTALVFESGERIPYSMIDTVRVGQFPNPTDESTGWKDILIINQDMGLLLIPDRKLNIRKIHKNGAPGQRALAENLARILEENRHSVDAFGKALPPRPVDLAIVVNKAYVGWNYPPKYLDARFKNERKAFDELFNSAREEISNTFRTEVVELLVNRDVLESAYSFHFAGGFKFGPAIGFGRGHPATDPWGPDQFDDIDRTQLNLRHDDLIALGPISLWFSEKMDPHGTPGINMHIRIPGNLYDSSRGLHTRPAHLYGASTRRTLVEWLEGGQDQIIVEVKKAVNEIFEAIERDIGSKALKEGQESHVGAPLGDGADQR